MSDAEDLHRARRKCCEERKKEKRHSLTKWFPLLELVNGVTLVVSLVKVIGTVRVVVVVVGDETPLSSREIGI